MRLAEEADQSEIPDGMSVPEELQRREDRLAAIAAAKAAIGRLTAESRRPLHVYRPRYRTLRPNRRRGAQGAGSHTD